MLFPALSTCGETRGERKDGCQLPAPVDLLSSWLLLRLPSSFQQTQPWAEQSSQELLALPTSLLGWQVSELPCPHLQKEGTGGAGQVSLCVFMPSLPC